MNDAKEQIDVYFADVQPELATRRSGILETSILQDRCVLAIGVGTGGAHAAVELAKCGVGRFILVDRDRLGVGNVVRHPGGISQVGRYKVNVVRDLIHEKNPAANVSAHCLAVSHESREQISRLIAEADVVICGTDTDLVLGLNIRGDGREDVRGYIASTGMPPKLFAFMAPAAPGSLSISGSAEACAFARAVREHLGHLTKSHGIKSTRLFFYGPFALAVFLGQQLPSTGEIHLFEFQDPGYVPSCRLRT